MIIYEGRKYKSYRDMGSLEAMEDSSKDRSFQDAEEDAQHQQLMHLMDALGEPHFHLVENQGATVVPGAPARPPFAACSAIYTTFA